MQKSQLRTLLEKYIEIAARETEQAYGISIPWKFRIRSSTIPNYKGKPLLKIADATEAIFIDEDHFYGEVEVMIDRVDYAKNQSIAKISFRFFPLRLKQLRDIETSFQTRVNPDLTIKQADD